MLAGRWAATSGTTRNIAANTDRPAAVRRSRAPRARPVTAMTVRYNDAPITSCSTPGSVSVMAEPPREDSRAVATKNSATAASRLNGSMKATTTISLAQSTGSRDGTTASVARIIPVAYSPLNASTPSMPRTSWANKMPTRLIVTPPAAELLAEILYGAPDPPIAAPRPTISTTAVSAHHQVERSARSLVHSARTTRTWVTGPATVTGTGASLVPVTAVIASLRRGTRRCPGSLA